MTIDWLTVSAQMLNFLILVGLLKHFLYRPILDGIDAREQEITTRMGEATAIEAKATAAQRDYHQQIERLQQEQGDTLTSTRQSAERERDAMLIELQQSIEKERHSAQHQQQRQSKHFVHELNNQAGLLLLKMTRKALTELSDETLEERLVLRALTTLEQDTQHKRLGHSPPDAHTAEVCTREPLSADAQAHVRASVATRRPELALSFDSNPNQSPGAQVQLGSVQVNWTIDTYVSDLADALKSELVREVEPTA